MLRGLQLKLGWVLLLSLVVVEYLLVVQVLLPLHLDVAWLLLLLLLSGGAVSQSCSVVEGSVVLLLSVGADTHELARVRLGARRQLLTLARVKLMLDFLGRLDRLVP